MKSSHSFGIIPLLKDGNKWKSFIVCHRNSQFWGFPKGHLVDDEDFKEGAQRELFEETHLQVKAFLPFPPITEHYVYTDQEGEKVSKTVTYFIATVVDSYTKLQEEELLDGKWAFLDDLSSILTYEEGREVAKIACLYLTEL